MVVSLSLKEQKGDVLNQAIRELQQGRSNATGVFTVTANTTSTVVQAPNCSGTSYVFLSPQTQDAASLLPTCSIIAASGQFTVTHASNGNTDCTFGYTAQGGN